MSGSGGGNSTTTQKADPWSGLAPYLIGNGEAQVAPTGGLYQLASKWMEGSGPQFYPGNTVAPTSDVTNNYENAVLYRAGNGSPMDAQASNTATRLATGEGLNSDATARGDFLNANPYLDAMVDASTRDINKNFSNTVLPGVASQFAAGGRYGSGAQAGVLGNVSTDYTNKLGDIVTGIRGTNYANERSLMEQRRGQYIGLEGTGANMLNAMNTEAYNRWYQDNAAAQQVGMNRDARAQGQVNADIARWDYGQNQPLGKLQAFAGLLQGQAGGGQSSSQTTNASGQSGFGKAATGALGGAATGAALGSVVPGIGTAVGAIGGAAVGLLSGFM